MYGAEEKGAFCGWSVLGRNGVWSFHRSHKNIRNLINYLLIFLILTKYKWNEYGSWEIDFWTVRAKGRQCFNINNPVLFTNIHLTNLFYAKLLFIYLFLLYIKIKITCMIFCVNVPVLSEQITLVAPRDSTAVNFLTNVCFLAILWHPIASVTVVTYINFN